MSFDNMHRIAFEDAGDPSAGKVKWSPTKSLGICAMYVGAAAGLIWGLRGDAVMVCIVKSLAILLLGHSVGMHRRLIHKSFACPKWLERCLVYMGCLVGLGGPFNLIRTHDFRDWAQRQPACHDYFAHRRPPLLDYIWQVHCDLKLDRPPLLNIEPEVKNDPYYRFMENHPVLIHLPWVIAFFAIGGWAWVAWGVCAQVAATATGHWLVGFMAHARHQDDWQVQDAGVQGRNVNLVMPRLPDVLGLLTMGENWHNNHHAFPGSARLGLYAGQADPGYRFIKMLEAIGLAWDVRLPHDLAWRPQLHWGGPAARPLMQPDLDLCPTLVRLRGLVRRRI